MDQAATTLPPPALHPIFAGLIASIATAPAAIQRAATKSPEAIAEDLAAHAAMSDCNSATLRAADLIRGTQLFERDLIVLAWAMQQTIQRHNPHMPIMRDAVILLRDLQSECAAAIREDA